ncbi:nicotinate-nucleotide pyrophosphorylase (carboxylating) [Bernardetia litoralis DSM 6794]|uniref:Probable nicotinate-nucleotide pyrophosphorylase [carboxylating] n=1 Tax=Bernardetia litoralis (strain ATCC 23117 / DSM 6794 / NBRC 15988 / NCIMB 1366 / Fx l1 / Sio-4) TaxID=880071 RepID=I4AHH2_BERLS|nr:carboxylating nicotinate-nucleotide diphosphorylase [Bernardetia litoralis]AFM03407.1 nicotinate-nucleotide pyrophosphorylase (carboxylating) [Bernardetia litoralis DSM 6794]
MYNYLTTKSLDQFITLALKEDIADGDHSTLSSVPATAQKKAHLLIKGDGILAGIELAKLIFAKVDKNLKIDVFLNDGDEVKYGNIAFIVTGNAQSILTAERLVLNCMQRMSGIATLTNKFVEAVKGTKTKILDTRKTTPNSRITEKWAVKIGGGTNHRYGLFDMIMLKDNHVDYAGGIEKAIQSAQNYCKTNNKDLKIEIETRNLEEVKQVLEVSKKGEPIDFLMLDNMTNKMMKEAVSLIKSFNMTSSKKIMSEASGGITLKTVAEISKTGVDSISVGALTHSYQSLDMSLKAIL